MSITATTTRPVGQLIRDWRERRRLSQLELSVRADISTRHLSFVETGRSKPTPQMILRLTEHLDVPLRERNELLLAGGFAPVYPRHELDAPELASIQAALRHVLDGHDPFPALVIDRYWDLLDANSAVSMLTAGCAAHLLEPPVNVLRLSLHPEGMAPRILNLGQWRAHVLEQLRRRSEQTADPRLVSLHAELLAMPGGVDHTPPTSVVVPLRIRNGDGELAFFSVTSYVQTAADVTVEELAIESFYPADAATARALHGRT
ncbi:helix-turn-helix transcriptional regulator [Nocardioides sp. W7]|uniref:helix-turn-helix domain-containing protein n=1 Tax=Nocardioides sp. W7 TaxID=2931390 RepID=UPI001FD2B267|nr:helix-turn-helix transcriptional regulator [Nocardioides sp. W7]